MARALEPDADPEAGEEEPLTEADRIEDAVFERLRRPYATAVLVAAMVGIHLWLGATLWMRGRLGVLGALGAVRPQRALIRFGAMSSDRVDQGEVWRLVTCVFLHGDGLHILVNASALWALGRLCEALYGSTRFVGLFLLAGVCGATFSWVGGNETSVGASGGIFGLMGAGMIFGWRYRERLPEPMSVFLRRTLLPWVVLNLAIGLVLPFIDNLGHVGGLVGGTIAGMVIGNRVVPGEEPPPWVRAVAALITAGALSWAFWQAVPRWH